MHYIRLTFAFMRLSILGEAAYRVNFFISILHSLLNFATGVLGLIILFSQVQTVQGWNLSKSLLLLGVYLVLGALRNLFIGSSLEALAGLGGEIWTGRFDFTLLRPVNVQFLASCRTWRIFSLFDLVLGLGVLSVSISRVSHEFTPVHLLEFLIALIVSVVVLYAVLLLLTSLVFLSAGFLFTWIFDSIFQMARYPVGLYPNWLRFILTWVIPVGIMTTIPAQAISGELSTRVLMASGGLALVVLVGASYLFHRGVRHYSSASS